MPSDRSLVTHQCIVVAKEIQIYGNACRLDYLLTRLAFFDCFKEGLDLAMAASHSRHKRHYVGMRR